MKEKYEKGAKYILYDDGCDFIQCDIDSAGNKALLTTTVSFIGTHVVLQFDSEDLTSKVYLQKDNMKDIIHTLLKAFALDEERSKSL